jgi:hypothetical protein
VKGKTMQLRKYFTAPFAALLLTGASLANAATPIDVTWNPTGAGITNAGAFTFDNVLINTYANIDITGGGTAFSEQGFARLTVFSNNGLPTAVPTAGLPGGTPYSLYISFTATGTQTAGIPSTGNFTSLNFSLLGAPGVTTFADSNNDGIFEVTGAPTVTLATGSLIGGSTSLTLGSAGLLPAAQILTTFVPNPAFAAFFVNPNAFTQMDLTAAFTNTGSRDHPVSAGRRRLPPFAQWRWRQRDVCNRGSGAGHVWHVAGRSGPVRVHRTAQETENRLIRFL